MRRVVRVLALAFVASVVAVTAAGQGGPPLPAERPQFVLLSFDLTPGARPLPTSNYLVYLSAVNHRRPEGMLPQNGYTLFLITGGLQLDPRRELGPDELPFRGILPRARPVVRYSRDLAHLRAKIANIRTLADAGVEMGSHAVRHDHGRHWDLARWRHEIADDRRIAQLHGLPLPQGFRAPFLEWNEHTYTALAEHGYRYDVSQGGGHAWPARDPRTGLWVFTMPHVGLPGRDEPVLYFDENVRRLLGAEARRRGLHGAAAQRWMDDAYVDAGLDEFERRYRGNRAPFVVGGHGVFRDAATRLMREVCPRPNVRCATFREAVDYLEAHPELAGAPALHGQRTLAFRRPRQAVR